MGIFDKNRELFKPEYNHNYRIQSSSYKSYSQKEVSLEENIRARCRIDNLQKIWVKNFILITILPVLFIIGYSVLLYYTGNDDMVLIFSCVFIVIYAGIVIRNMFMKDKLVNVYIIRKTKFYEILYRKISEKYTFSAEYSNKINEYINLFPKKYKMQTAVKELTGITLFFVFLLVFLLFMVFAYESESFIYYEDILIISFIVMFVIILIIVYKFFIIDPLKRKNEIWYEISLFEQNVAETFQQIIPDSNKNKKILNYPVDKSLKQPFAIYFIASIFTGFVFIIWDNQIVMAKQKYLSKAYLVEDYFVDLISE
ncbi:hypothetical protein [Mucispirillum schaedleri]|uniref:hypothetical protein n=1 Tax=Mucispirillum schaedleri TaxID=248039 RepID=UPI001F589963|nr:hypothetical protein [Mucispirillum schaedleri]